MFQEIDLATGTSGTIQSGNKKLLGKTNQINALQVSDGLIYSASSTSEGATVKVIQYLIRVKRHQDRLIGIVINLNLGYMLYNKLAISDLSHNMLHM